MPGGRRALASDKQNAYQGNHGENGRQTVEDPLAARHVDFQVVHSVVDAVQTAPQRQDDHQEQKQAADKAVGKGCLLYTSDAADDVYQV